MTSNDEKILDKKIIKSYDYRSLSVFLLIISGILLGLSHLRPYLWITAWLGISLLSFSLNLSKNKLWIACGLILGGIAAQWVGHPWYMTAVNKFGGGTWNTFETVIAWIFINLLMVIPEKSPIIFVYSLSKIFTTNKYIRFLQKNTFIWIPISILFGEYLNLRLSGLSQASWLYSQWQVRPILNTVAYIGWNLTTILCLTIASLIGESIFYKSFKHFILALLGISIILLIPNLNNKVPEFLYKIGAVHFSGYMNRPDKVNKEIELLIWPEVARSGRPRISEGINHNLKLFPPIKSEKIFHIIGQETRIKSGLQNSILALSPDGTLLASRAKKFLFPAGERKFLGFHLSHRIPYISGENPVYIDINGLRIAPLLCFEELDHSLAMEGKKSGAKLLTVSAIEETMGDTIEVQNQFIGVGVFLAVETGLPLVRSSMVGPAAFISPNGDILKFSNSNTNGILTLE